MLCWCAQVYLHVCVKSTICQLMWWLAHEKRYADHTNIIYGHLLQLYMVTPNAYIATKQKFVDNVAIVRGNWHCPSRVPPRTRCRGHCDQTGNPTFVAKHMLNMCLFLLKSRLTTPHLQNAQIQDEACFKLHKQWADWSKQRRKVIVVILC